MSTLDLALDDVIAANRTSRGGGGGRGGRAREAKPKGVPIRRAGGSPGFVGKRPQQRSAGPSVRV